MTVFTEEIPRRDWAPYFDGLSTRFRGWRVAIEVLSMELGDQWVAGAQIGLQGISLERKGSEAGDILVEAGELVDFMIHHVDRPLRVWIAVTNPGLDTSIEVESADGTTTLIHLHRNPELPPSRTRG
jgi:hypothetical protein